MQKLTLRAMAKINLGLDVVGKREDGYHLVRMIMQTLDLYDVLEFERLDTPEIRMTCSVEGLPCDERNLVVRAVKLMLETYGISGGMRIHLEKRIPMAAGMAGGSTDAAAALHAVNRLYDLGLSNEELKAQGVKLGADIPYCVDGGTALSEGIGEILTPLPACPPAYVLVAKPPVDVSTAFVYKNLRWNEVESHPDIDGIIASIRSGDIAGVADRLDNVLASVTEPAYPVVRTIRERMKELGALNALMSGSGPTVFGIFEEEDKARQAAKLLEAEGLCGFVCVTVFTQKTCVE